VPHQEPQPSPFAELFSPPSGGNSSPSADETNDPAELKRPETDDELYSFLVDRLGVRLPRVALAPDRVSPFEAFAAAYFFRSKSALWLAPRSGGKTLGAATLHLLRATFWAGYEGLSAGATFQQSQRGYSHLRRLLRKLGDTGVDFSLKSVTTWKNGSSVEIVSGSESAMRGPHPHLAALDEVDDMEEAVFAASRMMSVSGEDLEAQDLVTSTRKARGALMDKLVTEVEEAVAAGTTPAFDLYKWSIFECTQPQPSCRLAPENAEEKDCDLCSCHKVRKGQLEDGSPRTFDQACGGQLYRADGWITLDDLHKKYLQTDRRSWDSEMACERAATDRNILPNFRPGRNVLKGFTPLVTGNFYGSVDFGWTNPQATLLAVLLTEETEATLSTGAKVKLPASSLVIYDEIYRARTPHFEYVNMLKAKQAYWEGQGVPRTQYFFYDQQGARDASEWLRFGLPMRMYASKRSGSVEDSTRYVQNLDESNLFYVDSRCQNLIREISGWLFGPDGIKPLKATNTSDHCCDSARYLCWNLRTLHPDWIVSASEGQAPQPRQIGRPAASDHGYKTPDPYGASGSGDHKPLWIDVE
jgi:hypothetical protein